VREFGANTLSMEPRATAAYIRVMSRSLVLALLLVACSPSGIATPTNSPVSSSASPEPSPTSPPSRTAPEAAGCPVTLPASSWIADLKGLNPLPAARFSWYGERTVLAVDLPIDGVYRINAENPNLGAKVAWYRYLAGAVDISARRVDGSGADIKTKTIDGYGPTGFNPSNVEFTSEGCWQVTGSLQGHDLTFVIFVRRATLGEANP
jgi:hypothetical protein